MEKQIKLIIADDHQMFLEGICALLRDVPGIRVVDTALNGKQVLNKIESKDVDIVVTDISMPEMDGIALSGLLKKNHPHIKTLILSTHHDPEVINKCLQHQVDGYLLKNAEKKELLQALNAIAAGEKYFAQEVKDIYMNKVFSASREKEPAFQLSRREKEILIHISMELTAQEIADKLFISQNTVNTHRKNLMSKLNAKNTAGLVKYAMQQGFLEEGK